MKRILFLIVAGMIFLIQQLQSQHLTGTQVGQLVNSKHYMFEAQTMTPQRGGLRQLTTEYFLKVTEDTLISSLPYFGRAYTAPINTDETGYDFTSTEFEYAFSTRKKGRYIVSIKTKDRTSNTDFELSIFNNGNAYLSVNNNDRQTISFTGHIK